MGKGGGESFHGSLGKLRKPADKIIGDNGIRKTPCRGGRTMVECTGRSWHNTGRAAGDHPGPNEESTYMTCWRVGDKLEMCCVSTCGGSTPIAQYHVFYLCRKYIDNGYLILSQ